MQHLLFAIATILCYHEVDPPVDAHATIPRLSATSNTSEEMLRYTVTPENFAAQLDYLQQNEYHVIPLAQLVGWLDGYGPPLPEKAVVITVDDGWLCAYTHIAPELRRRGMPFTLFVYPRIVGRGLHAMTWSEISKLARDGVDIESHTMTHPFLTKLNEESLQCELANSRSVVEAHTGKPVRFLAYPYGDYNPAVELAAAQHGHEAAVTTSRGPITEQTSPLELKRYLVHNDTTLEEFKTFLP